MSESVEVNGQVFTDPIAIEALRRAGVITSKHLVIVVPSGIWWDLPDGRGSVYQDSGTMATVTLTKTQMVFGGSTKWVYRPDGYDTVPQS